MDENCNDVVGRIFDIQRFSIHDGDGIRTVVFLKGCVLACKWCCNPESQDYAIENMLVSGVPKVIGEDISVANVLDMVKKDRRYYQRSGGGMTLSGGECLSQPRFARALLCQSKREGINTAIESTACANWDILEGILPYIDTFLMDIKHIDASKHRAFTGKENSLMLENAVKIAKSGLTKLIIRVPIIPTFNCSEREIMDIAQFAERLPNVEEIHLLPYHNYGLDKYNGLGRGYALENITSPSSEQMNNFRDMITSKTSLVCRIGG